MIPLANPIYDVVFKGLMENEPAAKALLSALLDKKIIHLEPDVMNLLTTKFENIRSTELTFPHS